MKVKNILLGIFTCSLLLFIGCEDKYLTEEYITNVEGAEIISEQIDIKKDEWRWSEEYKRYEVPFNVKHIDQDVFEYGEVNASLFVTEEQMIDGKLEKYETLKFLPFSRVREEVIKDQNGNSTTVMYTEQFSFDYQVEMLTVYITNSDMKKRPENLDNFTFKISSILDFLNVP